MSGGVLTEQMEAHDTGSYAFNSLDLASGAEILLSNIASGMLPSRLKIRLFLVTQFSF